MGPGCPCAASGRMAPCAVAQGGHAEAVVLITLVGVSMRNESHKAAATKAKAGTEQGYESYDDEVDDEEVSDDESESEVSYRSARSTARSEAGTSSTRTRPKPAPRRLVALATRWRRGEAPPP